MRKKSRFQKASEVKVGVIGYGGAFNMGRAHIEEMKKAGMTPQAVCEIDSKRLNIAQEDFPGIETYDSVDAMLKKSKVNLLVIITPHNTHASLALKCLRAGRHVVCEKPLALTTSECDRMINKAKKQDLVLSTYHNRHWDGSIVHAIKMIKAGKIGNVVRVEAHMGQWEKPRNWWRSCKSISGGILYDWGVHLLEYTLQIVNSDVVEVTGFSRSGYWQDQTTWKKDTNEDEAFGVIRFANGIWSTLRVSSIDSVPRPTMMEITGTKGTYAWDYHTWTMSIPKANGQMTVLSGKNPSSHWWRFYENIANHLAKGEQLIITPEWSRRPIHILDLMNKSTGKGVSLRPKYK